MSRSTTLPPALAPWAVALSTLEPHLAQAIGPLVEPLDHLLSARDLSDAADGPLDGYEGLVRRGDPSHLVMSEWAMAEAVPEEFIRRAAAWKLLYLSPAHRVPRARGRTAVLVDPGPDQLGTGRLVQLAALVVLQRRAEARGVRASSWGCSGSRRAPGGSAGSQVCSRPGCVVAPAAWPTRRMSRSGRTAWPRSMTCGCSAAPAWQRPSPAGRARWSAGRAPGPRPRPPPSR